MYIAMMIETTTGNMNKKCKQIQNNFNVVEFVRERLTSENIFDAERQVLSKKWDGKMKRSVIKKNICKSDGQAKVKICPL